MAETPSDPAEMPGTPTELSSPELDAAGRELREAEAEYAQATKAARYCSSCGTAVPENKGNCVACGRFQPGNEAALR
jgi:hypothetical protein